MSTLYLREGRRKEEEKGMFGGFITKPLSKGIHNYISPMVKGSIKTTLSKVHQVIGIVNQHTPNQGDTTTNRFCNNLREENKNY